MNISLNSKFYEFMTKVADFIILSILWIVCSLPVITCPAATIALYYCALHCVRQEQATLVRSFFRAFGSNLMQGLMVFALGVVVTFVITSLGAAVYSIFETQEALRSVYAVYLVILLIFVVWFHFLLSYIARFQDSFLMVIKNSLFICIANLTTAISLLALFIIMIIVMLWKFPASIPFIILVPGLYGYLSTFPLERVYARYIPSIDETEEE